MPSPSSQLPHFHVAGFTGHRNLRDPDGVARAIRTELKRLQRDVPGTWTALSSIAAGADDIFVREALALNMPWRALLPLPPGLFREDFTAEEWLTVDGLLTKAMHIHAVAHDGPREDAYLDCGHETVNDSDILIAVWDGQEARGRGGTAEVVAYARKLEMPLIIIDPETKNVHRENMERLATKDPGFAKLNALPDPGEDVGANPFDVPEALLRFQTKTDRAAMRMSPRLRGLATTFLLLNILASVVGTALLAFPIQIIVLDWVEPACVMLAFLTALMFRRRRRHHEWVRWRLAAETCRSATAMWGLPRASHFLRDLEIPGLRFVVRSLHVMHQQVANQRTESLPDYRACYLTHRIDDQIAYFRRQKARARPRLKAFRAAFWMATGIAAVLTTMNALHSTLGWAPVTPFEEALGFVFFPIVLPVFAAACISVISINDWQRRVARYQEMMEQLTAARTQVEDARTWSSLEREVQKTERALLQEVLEWHTVSRYSDSQ